MRKLFALIFGIGLIVMLLAACGNWNAAIMRVGITDGSGGRRFDFGELYPFIDKSHVTMFPLVHFDLLFRDGLSYEVYGDTVTINKNVLDVITTVKVTIGSDILIKNGEEIEMNTSPIRKDGTIYFPLECVGSVMGYSLLSDDRFFDMRLRFIQFTSVFIYIWNENEDSSPDGLRFSYLISGQNYSDLDKIKANSVSDFEEVFAIIERLPRGATVLTTTLYRVFGYKIPWEIYSEITSRIYRAGYISSFTSFLLDEIPSIIIGLDEFQNSWYSKLLFSLNEDAIYNATGQVYRFFNTHRRFPDLFTVRLEINDDGTATIYYKRGDGEVSPHRGGLLRYAQADLCKAQTQEFLNLLEEIDFWNLPAELGYEYVGFGGNDVFFEGIKYDKHHIVYRWVPDKEEPIGKLETFFRNLIKQKFIE